MKENEENLVLMDLPATDAAKKKEEKPMVNFVQENLAYILAKRNLSLATVQRETLIPWGTLSGWSSYSVKTQMLDINIKELADFLDLTINELAFEDLRKRDERDSNT